MTEEQTSDRFDRYGALYILCSDFHTGQWSRGYRLLSRLWNRGFRPGLSVQNRTFESPAMEDYYDRWFSLRVTL